MTKGWVEGLRRKERKSSGSEFAMVFKMGRRKRIQPRIQQLHCWLLLLMKSWLTAHGCKNRCEGWDVPTSISWRAPVLDISSSF